MCVKCIQTVKTTTEASCGPRSPGSARRGAESAVGSVACQQATKSGIRVVASKVDAHLSIAECNQLSGKEIREDREREGGLKRCTKLATLTHVQALRIRDLIESSALCLGTPKLCRALMRLRLLGHFSQIVKVFGGA